MYLIVLWQSRWVQTFVSLLGLSQVDLGDGFEVDVPQSDAAISSSGGKSFLTGVHAENPCLHNMLNTTQEKHISHEPCSFSPCLPPLLFSELDLCLQLCLVPFSLDYIQWSPVRLNMWKWQVQRLLKEKSDSLISLKLKHITADTDVCVLWWRFCAETFCKTEKVSSVVLSSVLITSCYCY